MGDKDKIIAVPRADADARRALAERMGALHITRIGEMPRIELYLDQVLTLVTQELEFMQVPGDAVVTGSMVNNYVKQGVHPGAAQEALHAAAPGVAALCLRVQARLLHRAGQAAHGAHLRLGRRSRLALRRGL